MQEEAKRRGDGVVEMIIVLTVSETASVSKSLSHS